MPSGGTPVDTRGGLGLTEATQQIGGYLMARDQMQRQQMQDARAQQHLEIAQEQQKQARMGAEGRIIMGLYNKIQDPEQYAQVFNSWAEKWQLPYKIKDVAPLSQGKGNVFDTSDGRFWWVSPPEPGKPPQVTEITDPKTQLRLKEEAEKKRQERLYRDQTSRIEAGNQRAWIEHNKRKLEEARANQAGPQGANRQDAESAIKVLQYFQKQTELGYTLSDEEKEIRDGFKDVLEQYRKGLNKTPAQAPAPAGGGFLDQGQGQGPMQPQSSPAVAQELIGKPKGWYQLDDGMYARWDGSGIVEYSDKPPGTK